jgi:hypothetical protein
MASQTPSGPKPENAAARLGLQNQDGELSISRDSVLKAVGGWLGIIESVLPALVFVTILSLTKNTVAAVVSAVSISAFFLIFQLVRKKPLTQAVAGAIGIAISAFLPLRDGGQAADYFIQGFVTNAIYASVLAISVIIRWPIIGVLVGALLGNVKSWRQDKALARRFQIATLLWVGLFSARLLVQVPLYFSGQTELLGVFRIAMGVPLYALCIWFTWLLLRGVLTKSR